MYILLRPRLICFAALFLVAACEKSSTNEEGQTQIDISGDFSGARVITYTSTHYTCTYRSSITGTVKLATTLPNEPWDTEANATVLLAESNQTVTMTPNDPTRTCGVIGAAPHAWNIRLRGPWNPATATWTASGSSDNGPDRLTIRGQIVNGVGNAEIELRTSRIESTGTLAGTVTMPVVMR